MILLHDFDNLKLGAQIRCPTLILHGDPDPIVSTWHGRQLAKAIPGAEFVAVPGGAHDPNRLYQLRAAQLQRFLTLR